MIKPDLWIDVTTRDPPDELHRKALEKDLPSRAAFKIEELIKRVKLPPDACE